MIDVKVFTVGVMCTNAYVIKDKDTGEVAVIDPGFADANLTSYLDSFDKDKIKYILLTHGHFDHIGGAFYYSRRYNAEIVISEDEEDFLGDDSLNLGSMVSNPLEPFCADAVLADGDALKLGNSDFTFILTPGHTKGSGCFVFFDDSIIFSGDTLFYRSMGRTDFPTGNPSDMMESLKKLCAIEGDFVVYPGHDMSTTLQGERDNNPYLR